MLSRCKPALRSVSTLQKWTNASPSLTNQLSSYKKPALAFEPICPTAARNMSSSSTTIPPPKCLLKPMDFPRKLLMGPGPSNAPPRVLAANALPLLGHLHPEFTRIMDEIKEGLQYCFQTKNNVTLCVPGTGHAAMECAASNMVEPGDRVLVGTNGLWGSRFGDMAERNRGDVRYLKKNMGEVFTLEDIEKGLQEHKPALLFLTHGESSGSTCQPFEGVGDLCHKYNCLLIVDSVAALCGVPMYADKWAIDVVYSGAQKVLSAPPGVSPITFNDKAWEKASQRKTKPTSYYLDIKELANYWGCDGTPRRYHHTSPISSMYAIREGISALVEETLESCWSRHRQCGEMLHKGLEDMGLELLVKDKTNRLVTVTGVRVPEGVNWKQVADYVMNEYRVEISGGLGALAGKIWRIGVMGYNCQPDNVRLVLRALKEGLDKAGYKPA